MLGDVDRESVALWSIGVEVVDSGTPQLNGISLVLITVTDTNDNPPIFPTESITVSFSESAVQLSEVVVVGAVDSQDVGENRDIYYRILPAFQVPFDVDRDTGVIFLNGSIDYEAKRYFEFVVFANDDGLNSLNDSLAVRVNLINENDNIPEFQFPTYIYSILENSTIGNRLLINITATDRDSTVEVPVTLTYFISSGADNKFSINPDTAVVTVSGELDREVTPSYTMLLEVRDGELVGYANLVVTIVDVNEDGPVFDQASYVGYVREDASIGTFVIVIEATDSEFFNPINFILTEDGNGDFIIVSNTTNAALPFETFAYLLVNGSLDRETRDTYELSITAVDSGDRRSVRSIQINLMDVNDNEPVFQENPAETASGVTFYVKCDPSVYSNPSNLSCYQIQIQESAAPGLILGVYTEDIDLGENKDSTYSIESHNDTMFRIIVGTGQLFNDIAFNHEVEHQHVLTVTATNVGSPQQTAKALVVIDVVDTNDNKPNFTNASFAFSVFENNALNLSDTTQKFVGVVKATDPDDGPNGMLTYEFISGNTNNAFTVVDGLITVTDTLDRDTLTADTFDLILQATDGNIADQQTGTTRVIITVLDVNDNIPLFQQTEFEIGIDEEININVVIPVVGSGATDPDLGANGAVYYQLSDLTYFNVTPNGDIYPIVRLDYDTDLTVSYYITLINEFP